MLVSIVISLWELWLNFTSRPLFLQLSPSLLLSLSVVWLSRGDSIAHFVRKKTLNHATIFGLNSFINWLYAATINSERCSAMAWSGQHGPWTIFYICFDFSSIAEPNHPHTQDQIYLHSDSTELLFRCAKCCLSRRPCVACGAQNIIWSTSEEHSKREF